VLRIGYHAALSQDRVALIVGLVGAYLALLPLTV
jgi:hypothetical protein